MPLLNTADKLYFGDKTVTKVYLGAEQVWPSVSPEFSPASIAGLAIWLDAASYTPGSWPNKSGGASTALVGTPQPAVSTNQLNGLPLVRFSANEGRLRISSGTGVTTDFTLVYVARMVGPTAGRIVNGVYPPWNVLYGFWNGQQDVAYDTGSAFLEPNNAVGWDNSWKLYSADGSNAGSPTVRLFRDGIQIRSHTSSSQGWGGTFAINGYSPSGAEETCDCEVAEVLQYNRKLSDAERQQVEDYLYDRWFVEHTPPFEPADLPGSVLALEGSDVLSGPVTTWLDRSPAANHLVVDGGSPTGSGSYVTCTTANRLVTTNPLPMTGNVPRHFITLIRSRWVGGAFMGYGLPATGALFDLWYYGNTLIWHGHGGGYDTVAGAPALTPDEWHVVECFYTAPVMSVRVDGVGNDVQIPALATGLASMLFGQGRYSAAGDFDLAAFYGFDRKLSASEAQQVTDYIRVKWSLP